MDFSVSFVSVKNQILPCKIYTVDDICEVTDDEEWVKLKRMRDSKCLGC